MKKTVWIGKIPLYLFMLVLSVCALLPFYMMIVMGTHYSEDLYTGVNYSSENISWRIFMQSCVRTFCSIMQTA